MIRRRKNRRIDLSACLWTGIVAIGLVFAVGCSQEQSSDGATTSGADSIAYAMAFEVEDDAARLQALEKLVSDFPESAWAGRAYPRIMSLVGELEPSRVEPLLQTFLATDFESPHPYNAVGWNLAVEEEHLDLAIPILEKAVAKAREGGDSESLASCLDSEAWARYKKDDYDVALDRMEEAYATYGPGNDEIDEHMALIYDAAGRDEAALQIYTNLMGHMENPDIREKIEAIVSPSGRSMNEIDAEINKLRAANATPVTDFTLPSLADGRPISIQDFRGKAVLLNFWHPT
jgi:tetratricopeptide (TPR) repeat protein